MTNANKKAADKGQKMKTVLSITAKVNGFRRCGVAHPDTETQYDPADENFPFKDGDREILAAETMLVMSMKEVPVEAPDTDANE